MTIKKYRVHDWVKFNYSEIGEYIGEGYTDKPLRNDEIVELLNQLSEENEQLKQQLKTKVIVNKQYEELQRVKKENEQLKGEVAHYKLILMSLEQQAKRISGIRRNKDE